MLLNIWLFPFKVITLWREWMYRKIDRTFIGSSLKITKGGFWKKASLLPSYRYEFGAATENDRIHLIGGIFAPSVYTVTRRHEVFDVQTQKWRKLADYPFIIHHSGVTSDGEDIYVIGGNGLRITSYRYAHVYSPISNSWKRLPDMPTKRCALGLTYFNHKIYAVGGADNKKPLSTLEEYDIKKNIWKRLPDMPTAREHLFAVAAFGKVFAIGGYQNDRFHNVNTFESYDIEKKVWETLPPVSAKISGFSACVYGTSIFTFGGEQGWAVSSEVYEYKILEKKWLRRLDMPQARYAGIVAPASDGIHVIGGNPRMMTHHFSSAHDVFIP